jgi:hypothetical protein
MTDQMVLLLRRTPVMPLTHFSKRFWMALGTTSSLSLNEMADDMAEKRVEQSVVLFSCAWPGRPRAHHLSSWPSDKRSERW